MKPGRVEKRKSEQHEGTAPKEHAESSEKRVPPFALLCEERKDDQERTKDKGHAAQAQGNVLQGYATGEDQPPTQSET